MTEERLAAKTLTVKSTTTVEQLAAIRATMLSMFPGRSIELVLEKDGLRVRIGDVVELVPYVG